MSARRVAHLRDGADRRVVMLTLDPSGAVVGVAVPATNWHAWTAETAAFARRVGAIAAGLRAGRGIAAQRRAAAAMLALLEQIEDAEDLATLPERGRA
jgi:hypothetical protein